MPSRSCRGRRPDQPQRAGPPADLLPTEPTVEVLKAHARACGQAQLLQAPSNHYGPDGGRLVHSGDTVPAGIGDNRQGPLSRDACRMRVVTIRPRSGDRRPGSVRRVL